MVECAPNISGSLAVHAIAVTEHTKHQVDTRQHQHSEDIITPIVCNNPTSLCIAFESVTGFILDEWCLP